MQKRRYRDVAVIIPAFNEETVIESVVRGLTGRLPGIQVVVVDDCSSDGTSEVLRRLPVHRLRHAVNLGQGGALQTGLDFARRLPVDYFVTFDADGQHRPGDIPRLLSVLRSGKYDVALGSRFISEKASANLPRKRRRLLRLATLFTRVTTGMALTDTHNGLRALNRHAAEQIEITMNGMAHASEILDQIARKQLRWREVPVRIEYTEYSQSKGQKASNLVNILWDLYLRN